MARLCDSPAAMATKPLLGTGTFVWALWFYPHATIEPLGWVWAAIDELINIMQTMTARWMDRAKLLIANPPKV